MLKAAPVRALGAMSGTSLDGVDAAELVTDGERILSFGESAYRPYSPDEQAVLRAALGQWDGPEVAAAAELVETAHAELLSQFEAPDLVGFHGQTLAHDPAGGRTLQAGNGMILAETLERPVVWDFRTSDVELGGQGAPLAPFYHFALARHIDAAAPLGFVNLGGVGNLTWVDPTAARPEQPGALLAFDTGPANAPINDLMRVRLGKTMDEGGALAAQGTPDGGIVRAFLDAPYFEAVPPKSLDRNDFNGLLEQVAALSDADAAATLTACAAAGVAAGLAHCPVPPERLLLCGGGRLNPELRSMIETATGVDAQPVEAVGLDGDMVEAQAFAFLAVRVLRGLPTTAPGTTGVATAIGGGRVSYPQGLVASR
ncbi:MAG: anhydro-N-acetylmuramic acid kinase [Rhodobacterales bacterium]|nr:MAG: anhydro-N-acetylmuramic acid kinase [Rhodobacterales bacterium]